MTQPVLFVGTTAAQVCLGTDLSGSWDKCEVKVHLGELEVAGIWAWLPWTIWILPVLSAFWVYGDAKRRGIRRTGKGGPFDNDPAGWVVGMLFLWIVVFPAYLIVRARQAPGRER